MFTGVYSFTEKGARPVPDAAEPSRLVRFGDYEVDVSAGCLRKCGLKISLREQSFQVLAALLEHPGEVVTREELRKRLWAKDVYVEFDNNLNSAMARLREALSDPAEHPRFIETLPKRGYRFIATLSKPAAPRARLLVLPFANLSGDPAQEYFSDAMTDEVISEFAGLAPEQLAVIARTTAMHYKGSHKDVSEVGRELAVDYVVEGGVRRTGDRIAVNAQLIRVKDQTNVWAQRYDAHLNDIFEMQGCIARGIAAHIGITPIAARGRVGEAAGEASARKPTEDLAAYNEYIQGRFYLAKLTPAAFAEARQHFEEAIARDPNFALAYDSLAEIYWWQGYLGFMRPVDAFSTGGLYALRALEIDNTLAETHALLAQYHKQLDYNWPEVEREMARALALNPTSPVVRVRYAMNALMPHGRLEEAVAELEAALEFDPLSTYTRTMLAITFILWHRYDQAIAEARRLLEIDPSAYWGYLVLGSSYRELRRFEEAIAAHRRAVELSGGTAAMLGWLGLSLGLGGKKAEARGLLNRLHEMTKQAYVPPSSLAWTYLGLGQIDSAFEWLDRAVDARDQLMMPIKSYAFFDPIRTDPRFLSLLRKMKLE
jgi:TolB-like protein/Tfp pilus assembly protein PilF